MRPMGLGYLHTHIYRIRDQGQAEDVDSKTRRGICALHGVFSLNNRLGGHKLDASQTPGESTRTRGVQHEEDQIDDGGGHDRIRVRMFLPRADLCRLSGGAQGPGSR